jgi:hypothetical protein
MREVILMADARLWAVSLTVIILASAAACSEPKIGDRISPTQPPSESIALPTNSKTPTTPSPEPTTTQKLGEAPANLREVDWSSATLPGDFCDIDSLVKFKNQRATAKSKTWGKIHLRVWPKETQYGDLDADGQDEAAVNVDCNTGGETAGDVVKNGYAVVRAEDGFLLSIGTITAKQQAAAGHQPTRLKKARFGRKHIVVRELFYRSSDPNCCPTGEADTTWTLQGNRLIAGPPRVIS